MGGRRRNSVKPPAAVVPTPRPRRSFPGAIPPLTLADPPSRLLSVDVVADRLGFAEGTIRNWISQGKIEYVKIGGKTKFREADIEHFIREHTYPRLED